MNKTLVSTVTLGNKHETVATASIYFCTLADGFSAYTVKDGLSGFPTIEAAEDYAIDEYCVTVYAASYVYRQGYKIKITREKI